MERAEYSTENEGPLTPRQQEIGGILLFSLAVFAIVSLYVQNTGIIGYYLQSSFRLLFGETAVIFGIILLVLALHLFSGKLWGFKLRKIVGFSLLIITGVAIFHLLTVYQGYQLPPDLHEEIEFAKDGQGAGIFGAIIMVGLLTGFGILGTYIIAIGLIIASLIMIFDVSLVDVFKFAGNQLMNIFKTTIARIVNVLMENLGKIQEWRENHNLAKMDIFEQESKDNKTEATVKNSKQTNENEEITIKQTSGQELAKQKKNRESAKEAKPSSGNKGRFKLPPAYILKKNSTKANNNREGDRKKLLEDTFSSFGISAKVVNVSQGPVVTRYELQPGPGIKVSKITGLADDLALALAAADVRVEAPVPGKSVVGIEVPNRQTAPVLLRDVIEHPEFTNHSSHVALALGKDIAGNPVVADLKKWLHLLVAGSTGSGKSVCLNSIIASLLYKANPDEVKFLMIDPKRVEFATFAGIPHLISPVITDPKKAAFALKWAVSEMERRYQLFADKGVRNIDMYSELPENEDDDEEEKEHLPYIVIIIDELADLMMVAAAEVEDAICRIAQMARAAGMYLVIATQRPSVDVITGLIKANVPSRIAFAVSSQVDSRTILDMSGAERLIGKGDMLFYPIGSSKPTRAQGAWISDKEVESLVKFWKKQAEPEYKEKIIPEKSEIAADSVEDELLDDAINLVVNTGQASISMLQRRFRIGYSRAARLIDSMELKGIVGSYQGSKPREVLIDRTHIDSSAR